MSHSTPERSSVTSSLRQTARRLRAWALTLPLRSAQPPELSPAERAASKAFSVVIAVHNSAHVVARCIAGLERYGGACEVVFVDDGSTDPTTVRLLDVACSRNSWTLLRQPKPTGHSRASERGVAASSRPYICLLNSDAIVGPNSWAGILTAFEADPAVAVVGPSTSHTFGPQTVSSASHCRHYWSNEHLWTFSDRYVARHGHEPSQRLPFLGGFAFYVRRSAWDTLKGFDPNLPDYGNEKDFCNRATAAGFALVWTKASYVHHLGGESYGVVLGRHAIQERSEAAEVYMRSRTPSSGPVERR